MLDDFLGFVKENSLIQKGDKILIGVSGGIDSVALLDILFKLKKKLGIDIAVAHVNYGLRKESDQDHEFVKALVAKKGVSLFDKKVKLSGVNIEEKARDIRYEFFNEIASAEGFGKVAVAHHKNDLVETFFLNAARGSGLTGLVSMKPVKTFSTYPFRTHQVNPPSSKSKEGYTRCVNSAKCQNPELIRPMLFTTRKQIEKYAQKNKLKFTEDVTNKDLSFRRNLIRHEVIPALEKTNPDLVQTISEEVANLRDVNDFIQNLTKKEYAKLATEKKDSVEISAPELKKITPQILQTEILRMTILQVKKDLRDISRKNIEDILKLSQATQGTKKIHLPGGLIAERVYDRMIIRKSLEKAQKKPKKTELKFGKKTVFGKWSFFLDKAEKIQAIAGKNLVFLDIQKELKLLVRCRKAGDKMKIGGGKTKKLQDIFVDAKIPRTERDFYPIVTTKDNEVVWIPGIRVSEKFKVKTKNKETVRLIGKII